MQVVSDGPEVAVPSPNDLGQFLGETDMAAKPESLHWTRWVELILAIALFVGGIVWVGHLEIGTVNAHLGKIDRRLDKFDSAIRLLTLSQSGDTKELINEILEQAKDMASSGDEIGASRFLAVAAHVANTTAKNGVPATPQFFESAVKSLSVIRVQPDMLKSVIEAKVSLAAYRSSLNDTSGFSIMRERKSPVEISLGFTVANSSFRGGTQPLDGMNWVNVLFIDAHIVYNGGPVTLHNVRFVNCTFSVPDSIRGDSLLDAAILNQAFTKIG